MEKSYVSQISGKEFNSAKKCAKHEVELININRYFKALVAQKFFPRFKIQKFFHNANIEDLGDPTQYSWQPNIPGYVRMSGRMGNVGNIVKFKIRKQYLLILFYVEERGWKYLGKIRRDWIIHPDSEEHGVRTLTNWLEEYNKKPIEAYNTYLRKRIEALSKLTEEDIKILNIHI